MPDHDLRAAVDALANRHTAHASRIAITKDQAAALYAHLCNLERMLAKAEEWCPSEDMVRDPQLVRDLVSIRATIARCTTRA